MSETPERLMAEFAADFADGEHPDPRGYLERAGDGADALRGMIDDFLRTAVPPAPDPAIVEMFEAWAAGHPPILTLRTLRGLERTEVVAALVRDLELDPGKTGKVARYYHRLETGLLDLMRVSPRAIEAVARILRAPFDNLALPMRPATAAPDHYLRASASDEVVSHSRAAMADVDGAERDEVDDLFDREPV